jgi:hypothetical protein
MGRTHVVGICHHQSWCPHRLLPYSLVVPYYAHNTDRYQIKTRYNKQWSQSRIRLSELQVAKESCIRTKQRVTLWETSHIIFSTSNFKNNPTHWISQQISSIYVLYFCVPVYTNSLLIFLQIYESKHHTSLQPKQSIHHRKTFIKLTGFTFRKFCTFLWNCSTSSFLASRRQYNRLTWNKLKHNTQSVWNYCFVWNCSLEGDIMCSGRNLQYFRIKILLPYSG